MNTLQLIVMGITESSENSEIVSVTKHGQATIPKRFREKLGIGAPGRVAFRETEDGTIVVERVRTPEEMRGFAAGRTEASTEEPATALLHEDREQERKERDARGTTEE